MVRRLLTGTIKKYYWSIVPVIYQVCVNTNKSKPLLFCFLCIVISVLGLGLGLGVRAIRKEKVV